MTKLSCKLSSYSSLCSASAIQALKGAHSWSTWSTWDPGCSHNFSLLLTLTHSLLDLFGVMAKQLEWERLKQQMTRIYIAR